MNKQTISEFFSKINTKQIIKPSKNFAMYCIVDFFENKDKINKLMYKINSFQPTIIYCIMNYLDNKDDKDIKFKLNCMCFKLHLKSMPRDILSIIMSFNYDNSVNKKNYKKVMTQLKYNITNIDHKYLRLNEVSIYNYKLYNSTLKFCIKNHFKYKTLEMIIDNCNRCNCCKFHCSEKTRNIEYNKQQLLEELSPHNYYNGCHCLCRQDARTYFDIYHLKLELGHTY
jgi:hypothetical protein